jgi:hypothetical protein
MAERKLRNKEEKKNEEMKGRKEVETAKPGRNMSDKI